MSFSHNPWIIDFEATEHMNGSSTSLLDYHHVSSSNYVTFANGSQTSIVCLGNAYLNPNIDLSIVLHVSIFPFSLLSVSKITTSLQDSVTF